MKRPAPSFADRMVMLGGFLAVLSTGFFGAEPPRIESASPAYIQCAQTQSNCSSYP